MELYEIELEGTIDTYCRYHNVYKVVAEDINTALKIVKDEMVNKNNLQNVQILNVKFIESGILV